MTGPAIGQDLLETVIKLWILFTLTEAAVVLALKKVGWL